VGCTCPLVDRGFGTVRLRPVARRCAAQAKACGSGRRCNTSEVLCVVGMDMQNVDSETPSAGRRRYVVGIVLLLAAAVLWSLSGALIKVVSREGVHGVAIAFYRSLFAGLFLLPIAYGKFHTLAPRGGESGARPGPTPSLVRVGQRMRLRPAAISCVVFFTLMTGCFVWANTQTEAANVIILQYTSTFWVFLLSPWLLGEKPRRGDLPILAVAMVGIGVIFAGGPGADLPGLMVSLGSGLFFGLLTLMIRLMRDSNSAAVAAVNCLGSAVLLFPVVLWLGGANVSGRVLVVLLVLGFVQFGLPYYLYTVGLTRVPAYQAALITMLEPVLNPLWTFLAVGETVPWTTFVGGGVILSALLLFIRAARPGKREAH